MGAQGRKTQDWFDAFVNLCARKNTPPLFAKWTALIGLATATERKVWVRTYIGIRFLNLYALFVGTSGAGKTVAADVLFDALKETPRFMSYLSPDNMTRASFNDAMHATETKKLMPDKTSPSGMSEYVQSPMTIFAAEFGAMIPQYDGDFINTLTTMYDGKTFRENKRGLKDPVIIRNPNVNMLACCTPDHLRGFLPDIAWRGGFMSRTVIVHARPQPVRDWFDFSEVSTEELPDLVKDLEYIADNVFGEFMPDAATRAAINTWREAGCPPKPSHPKLITYNERRDITALKIAALFAIGRGAKNVIELDDWNRALALLFETEEAMEDALVAVSATSTDGQTIEETWNYVYSEFNKLNAKRKAQGKTGNIYITKQRVTAFLQSRVPAYAVDQIMDIMVKSGTLVEKTDEATLLQAFAPGEPPRLDMR